VRTASRPKAVKYMEMFMLMVAPYTPHPAPYCPPSLVLSLALSPSLFGVIHDHGTYHAPSSISPSRACNSCGAHPMTLPAALDRVKVRSGACLKVVFETVPGRPSVR